MVDSYFVGCVFVPLICLFILLGLLIVGFWSLMNAWVFVYFSRFDCLGVGFPFVCVVYLGLLGFLVIGY